MKEIIKEKLAHRFTSVKQITPLKEWEVSVLGDLSSRTGNGFILIGDAGVFAMTFSGEGVLGFLIGLYSTALIKRMSLI